MPHAALKSDSSRNPAVLSAVHIPMRHLKLITFVGMSRTTDGRSQTSQAHLNKELMGNNQIIVSHGTCHCWAFEHTHAVVPMKWRDAAT